MSKPLVARAFLFRSALKHVSHSRKTIEGLSSSAAVNTSSSSASCQLSCLHVSRPHQNGGLSSSHSAVPQRSGRLGTHCAPPPPTIPPSPITRNFPNFLLVDSHSSFDKPSLFVLTVRLFTQSGTSLALQFPSIFLCPSLTSILPTLSLSLFFFFSDHWCYFRSLP